MGTRIVAMTFILTFTLWVFAAPMLTGCGEGEIYNSNTNRVENGRKTGREDGKTEGTAGSGHILMDMIRTAVVDILGDNYWPDKQLTKEELETETGIGEELYEEYFAEKQKVETDIDMMVILKVRQGKMAETETLLNGYRDSLLVKYKERPQELGKAAASRIEIIDRYICFVQLGADTSAAAQAGDEEVLNQCQQENERAVDIIERTIYETLLIQEEG